MKNTTAFVLLLISFGMFYTFINPQYAKVQALRAEADQYDSILDNAKELEAKRDELLVTYQSIPRQDLERVMKVVPDNIDTVRLALDFDSIAAKYGISIKKIDTDTQEKTNNATVIETAGGLPYEVVTVSFSFVATYENFRKFMEDIESSLRIIDIQSVSFTSSESGLYDFSVSINTYWLK